MSSKLDQLRFLTAYQLYLADLNNGGELSATSGDRALESAKLLTKDLLADDAEEICEKFAGNATPAPRSSTDTSALEFLPILAENLKKYLKEHFPGRKLELFNLTNTDWPDGSLGLAKPGEISTLAVVAGWAVHFLSHDRGNGVKLRANMTGSKIKREL